MLKGGPQRVLGIAAGPDGCRLAEILTDGVHFLETGEHLFLPAPDCGAERLRAVVAEDFSRAALVGAEGLDAVALADALGLPVAHDFGAADRRMGGLGGPMSAFHHFARVRARDGAAPVAVADLGANGGRATTLSWIDPARAAPEEEGALLAFECGPGIAVLPGAPSEDPAGGMVDEEALASFLEGAFFLRMPPKLWPEQSGALLAAALGALPEESGAASARACIAAALFAGIDLCPEPPAELLLCGAGAGDATLRAMIEAGADCPVATLAGPEVAAEGLAYLAARTLAGLPTSAPGTTGVAAAVGGAGVARPAESRVRTVG